VAENENEQVQDGRVSVEAHNRVKTENAELRAKLNELSAVVKDVGVRDRARAWFKEQGAADPDWAAEFVIPHIRDVEPDSIGETLGSDRFKPLLGNTAPQPAPEPTVPPLPEFAGFGGPQPGGGSAQPPGTSKINPRSSEFRNASPSQVEQWDRDGMVDWHPLVKEHASAPTG
jgi:hypothetical protein